MIMAVFQSNITIVKQILCVQVCHQVNCSPDLCQSCACYLTFLKSFCVQEWHQKFCMLKVSTILSDIFL
jgi:hypothetical protein